VNQDYLHELMNTLVSAARVSLEPLDSHFIASGDAAFKDDYLTLLAALLLENGALNDAQQRLLLLLLPSIGPAFPLPHYLQQAGKLDAVALTHVVQSVRGVKQAGLALLFDFAVLQRLAGPLTPRHVERLSWLAKLTEVTEEQILQINFWSTRLLGMKTSSKLFSSIEKPVYIANVETKQFSESTSQKNYFYRTNPQLNQFLKRGKYSFYYQLPLTPSWHMFGQRSICRSVTLSQSGFVTKIVMNEDKSKTEEYGKKGEAIFSFIALPSAFNAWNSYFAENAS